MSKIIFIWFNKGVFYPIYSPIQSKESHKSHKSNQKQDSNSKVVEKEIEKQQEKIVEKKPKSLDMLSPIIFSESVMEIKVSFFILPLNGSYFIWIGSEKQLRMSNLLTSISTKFDSPLPISTLLFGTQNQTLSSLSSRVCKKLDGHPVSLSYNLPDDDPLLVACVEKVLISKLKKLKTLE